jgi:hypothetical protein
MTTAIGPKRLDRGEFDLEQKSLQPAPRQPVPHEVVTHVAANRF